MNSKCALTCKSVSHWFDAPESGRSGVLHEINFSLERGSITSFVGPSGCGKSTLLRAILGTHSVQRGEIIVHSSAGESFVDGPGRDRGIVYQQYSLYPFMTALENVAIGLKFDQTSYAFRVLKFFKWRRLRRIHLAKAEEMLSQVGLADSLHLYPHEMSGGMRQRVALAQALIMQPAILLLDEPFGALDESTRTELQQMLRRLRRRDDTRSIILVTHDLNEAISLCNRVIGFSRNWAWRERGFIECPGSAVVYDAPTPQLTCCKEENHRLINNQRAEIWHSVFGRSELQLKESSMRPSMRILELNPTQITTGLHGVKERQVW